VRKIVENKGKDGTITHPRVDWLDQRRAGSPGATTTFAT
jgi:hypothetical protein